MLYVGTQAIAHIHNKGSTPSMSTITHSAHMDIFQNLAVDLDTEGELETLLVHAVSHLQQVGPHFKKDIEVLECVQ